MDKEKTKDNVVPDEKKLDIKKVLNDYSVEELNAQACENLLLGNFDENKNYKILDIFYPELINISKSIQKNNNDSYIAVTVVNNLKLNFEVKFEIKEENKMSATLVLHEKFVVGGIYETILSTTLQTIVGENNVEFLSEVKKNFHLHNGDDDDQQDLLENYVSPPIELSGELLKKTELYDIYKLLWKDFEKDYINKIFNILKKSEDGQKLIKKFLQTVKNYDLTDLKCEKCHTMKAIFDKILDEEISNKALEKEQFDEIVSARNEYTQKINEEVNKKLKEQIAMLKPETVKPAPTKIEAKQQKPAQTSSQKPSPSKSSSSSSSSKPASSPKKDDKPTPKEEKKKPFIPVPVQPVTQKATPTTKIEHHQIETKKALNPKLVELKPELLETLENKNTSIKKEILNLPTQEL